MFKLDDNEDQLIKDWPVLISKPADGGKVQKHEVTADFVLLPQDEYNDLLESSKDDSGPTDIAILKRVVSKLGGFADAEGKAIEYSEALLAKVCQKTYIRTALLAAYWDASAGRKAQRKN